VIAAVDRPRIRPHPGPQERFLSTPADICLYGGAAGAGKSYGLLLHPLRHIHVRGFTCECFRQTTGQVRNPGSIWDEARGLYSQLGAWMRDQELDCTWPSGARVKFGYLDHASDRYSHQGSQICMLLFDELTLVGRGSGPTREAEEARAEATFWYMLSRNRSTCGVKPCCRGTVNPDAASWVARLIAWWIDQTTGYPITERSGVLRWFYRVDGKVCWFDSREQAKAACPELAAEGPPKSFTFIAAKLEDNPTLQAKDPGYRSNLMAQEPVEGARLLAGNWRVREVVPGAPIFTFSGSLEDDAPRAARSRLVYDEEDDRWAGIGGPEEARRALVSVGAWDFGTGPSMLVCLLAMLELPPANRPDQLPRIWLDDELWWYAENWLTAAKDVRQRVQRNGYGRHILHVGDPTGKNRESDQQSWETNLRAGGIPLRVLPDWANTNEGREWLIRTAQLYMDSGKLIWHSRCRKWNAAVREWRRDIPGGAVLEGLDLERIKPKHDQHSHPGMAGLYLVCLVHGAYRSLMGHGKQGQEATAPNPRSMPKTVEGSLSEMMRGFRL
jgi:hypothetical protein